MALNAATLSSIRAFEKKHGYLPDALLNVMLFETAGTLSPAKKNNISGATGLIQFMPSTASDLGTSTRSLSLMTVDEQLVYVDKYLTKNGYKKKLLVTNDILDYYLAILYPALMGKADTAYMASNPTSKIYLQNKGLDFDKDGDIQKGDIRNFFQKKIDSIRSLNNLSVINWGSLPQANKTPDLKKLGIFIIAAGVLYSFIK